MNKRFLSLIAFLLITICVTGQNIERYRVWLTDKAENSYNIERPEEFLSTKAIERRAKHNIAITEQDLPVSDTYLQQIKELGFNIFITSRWMNTVVVAPTDSTPIEKIEQLPFVKKIECVQNKKSSMPFFAKNITDKAVVRKSEENSDNQAALYGAAWEQINQLNLAPLHQAGYCGNGMTIAVLDAGFYCIDMHPAIDQSKILGTHDFTRKSFSYKNGVDHGASVLMCIATNAPNTCIGTAPEATFWLFITEDNNREFPKEEDNWVAGAEMADSVGADIITSSLGYNIYDDPDMSYTHDDMDGKTAFCSRGATIAASKGILVVTAAGNEYGSSWEKIVAPGDAEGVLTVGSINLDGSHSSFSSVGYTADGRVKPDVVALGNKTKVLNTNGDITSISGTSFATPLMTGAIACLWQAHPEWSVAELIDHVQQGASQYHAPDSLLGYGLPNIWEIHCKHSAVSNTATDNPKLYVSGHMLYLNATTSPATTLALYDTCGRKIWHTSLSHGSNKVDLSHIERGIYIATLTTDNTQMAQKIVIR